MVETDVRKRAWWLVPTVVSVLSVPLGYLSFLMWALSGLGGLSRCASSGDWTHDCTEMALARDIAFWLLVALPVTVVLMWVWPRARRFDRARWAFAVVTLLWPVVVFVVLTTPS